MFYVQYYAKFIDVQTEKKGKSAVSLREESAIYFNTCKN